MVIEIPLTKGYVTIIDDDDFELVGHLKWHVLEFKDGRRYATRTEKRTSVYLHKMITGYKLTDHKDGDGLNNRRDNLREATHSQNHANQPKRRGLSKYKGVTWHNIGNKWMAKILFNQKPVYLGLFINEEDAARAYDRKALELWGDFAVVNFPNETKELSTE